ncbi:uncharacterized protein LACBIDRAFT_314743 [Laccaria bicolor S238N-H82]|uniref:Predicted protein n=1 Tax=Laccaria bicolor (strain S238N-H82 / ATCC MYA-4686) TaxID=486041 RepID=B0DZ52_LACBS|nr:uncharacterized protein LACBIDRAFT_314743 [Laccaria bicolor S238N-H82]EDR00131.1 predicted protein [Laccaria bicolor S238N-H82]|eukprot:XP_001889188.1 predicted protein [Laccaria bicolor S238N-H82]
MVMCTGVEREVQTPEYERGKTSLILVGVARLSMRLWVFPRDWAYSCSYVQAIHVFYYHCHHSTSTPQLAIPVTITTRVSIPDQRFTSGNWSTILQTLEAGGPERPPGVIIVGWSVLGLWSGGAAGMRERVMKGQRAKSGNVGRGGG